MRLPVDEQTEQAVKKDALTLRARLLDRRAVEVAQYAGQAIRFEMLAHLISTNRSVV